MGAIARRSARRRANRHARAAGAEVDLVLHKGDSIIGVEVKRSPRRLSTGFKRRYPDAQVHLVTMDNFY